MARAEPMCDFCSRRPVVASFPCRNFVMNIQHRTQAGSRVSEQTSTGPWAACQKCYDLIVADNEAALIERTAALLLRDYPQKRATWSLAEIKEAHRQRFDEFWKHKYGEPIPASETDWDAVPDYNRVRSPDGQEFKFRPPGYEHDEPPDIAPTEVKLFKNAPKQGYEWLEARDVYVTLLRAFPETAAQLGAWEFCSKRMLAETLGGIADTTAQARIVVWQADQWATATRGHIAFNDAPLAVASLTEPQLWVFDQDWVIDAESQARLNLTGAHSLGAILVLPLLARPHREYRLHVPPGTRGIGQVQFYLPELPSDWWRHNRVLAPGDVPQEIMMPRVRYFPPFYEGEKTPLAYCLVEAGRAFMDLPVVGTQRAPGLSRQVSRHYAQKKPEHNPLVETIILRRLVSPKHAPADAGEHKEMDYTCQWWVTGHWRKRAERYHKGTGAIWVNPHVRGPEDRPLKPVGERIIRVRR